MLFGSTWPLRVLAGHTQPSSGLPAASHRVWSIPRTRGVIGSTRRAEAVFPCVTSNAPFRPLSHVSSGGFTFPIQLLDERSGTSITSPLAIAVGVDPFQPGVALAVVADPSNVVPLQFAILIGAPQVGSSSSSIRMAITPLQSSSSSEVSLPVRADTSTAVRAPLPTTVFGSIPPPPLHQRQRRA